MAERKYLEFVDISASVPSRKTKTIRVLSAYNGSILGKIFWYSGWRRYIFSPLTGACIFDSACLKEITNFIDDLMDERKK